MSFSVKGLADLVRSYKTAAKVMAAGEARAVKRSGVTILARQSRAIAQVVNLKVGVIKEQIRTVRQPTAAQPRIVFEVRAKAVPLSHFIGSRVTSKGLSVQPMKGGPRKVLTAGFVAGRFGGAGNNSARVGTFFGRAAKFGKGYGSPHVGRTPIVKLYGPNVLSQYIKDPIQAAGVDAWNTRLPIELEREITYALKRAGLI